MTSPLLSILMPTRNRAHLLAYALQSAVEQDFDDYEIVVSDNESTDHTAEVVRRFDSGRIRYVRTGRLLSMPDSFEFARSFAGGEWLTFLADDDAFCSGLLRTLAGVTGGGGTRVVSWHAATYWHPAYGDPAVNNRLMTYPFTGCVRRFESRRDLEELFSLRGMVGPVNHRLPRMINSACRRDAAQDVAQRLGRLFLPPAPDYSACAALLGLEREYAFIDVPLMLGGKHPRGPVVITFPQEFQGEELFRHVPLPIVVTPSVISESLLRVREAMPAELGSLDINWRGYWIRAFQEIPNTGRRGADIWLERKEFVRRLSRQRLGLQGAVLVGSLAASLARRGRRIARRAIDRSETLTRLDSSMRRTLVNGRDANFGNIVEAARYLERTTAGGDTGRTAGGAGRR